MAKVRVYELAKEFGVESKVVMAKLQELGEFVRSASSTVEAPVVRKLKETFPRGGSDGTAAPTPTMSPDRPAARPSGTPSQARPGPVDGAGPAATAPAAPAAPASPEPPQTTARPAGPRPGAPLTAVPSPAAPAAPSAPAPVAPAAAASAAPAAPAVPEAPVAAATPATPAAPAAPAAGGAPRPGGGPRPGNNPFSSGASTGMGRPSGPRPGNNPFSSGASTGMGRPAAPGPHGAPGAVAPGAPGAGPAGPAGPAGSQAARTGPGAAGPRPGGPRPGSGFAGQGDRGAPGGGQGAGPGGPRPNPGMMPPRPQQRPGGGQGGPGGFAGRPAGPGARPGSPGGFAGRPGGGAGGPAGAGRPGGGGGGFAGRPGGGAPGAGPGAGGGGFAGRPGGGGPRGRGGTAGAFGRPGGRPTRGRKSKKQRRQEFDNMQAPSIGGVQVPHGDGTTPVRLRRGSTLTDFAEKIGANPASLVTVLFTLGEMATATQSLDADTFAALGNELGFDVQIVSAEDEDAELLESFDMNLESGIDDEDDLEARPPVVTVMGHVDHGKTRLLDAIRKTNVQAREAGGITQHIGAYQVHHVHQDVNRAITFIDTPGHEAFTAMRARGAKTTDIVILVVAADDGVMPQTIEALNHALAAEVPIVVAVNKVDKEGANPAKVRQQLTEYGLVAEEYGGETMFVDVSALSGIGIDSLLEAVLLTADAALELVANPHADARGVAIEAHLDRGRGPVATVLVQRGTLRVGDSIVAGTAYGRVRALLDDAGEPIQEAGPSRPVMVLGLTSVPGAGDKFLVTQEDRVARQIAERRGAAERNALLAKARKRVSLEDLAKILEQGRIETLNLILKGDVSGSVEALEDALLKIDVGELVDLRIIHRGVGSITEQDITLASASEAIVIGFNVRPEGRARELAEREGIDVRFYSVIYAAIDDVELALTGLLKPEYEEVQLGTAEVREIFRSSKFGNIAGCLVRSGEIRRNSKARVSRGGTLLADNLQIQSLKRFKDDATEVREGFECGIGLGSFNDLRVDDVIETFEMREKPRS